MTIEQALSLLAVLVVCEMVCPYGQMVVSYDAPEWAEDLWIWDFARALLWFGLAEIIAKGAAYGVAIALFLSGEPASVLIFAGIAAINTFYLARRKLDRLYSA